MTTNEAEYAGIGRVTGDGGSASVSAEELRRFKAEASAIARGAATQVQERRRVAEEVRHCVWEHRVCTILEVGRQLRNSSLIGDKAIRVKDETGEYVSICNAWVPKDYPLP